MTPKSLEKKRRTAPAESCDANAQEYRVMRSTPTVQTLGPLHLHQIEPPRNWVSPASWSGRSRRSCSHSSMRFPSDLW